MKNLISGILAVALVAGPASAQQVTTKLPSATVKLNGAAGGGSGTGFVCDAGDLVCLFQAPAGYGVSIFSDAISLGLEDETLRLETDATGVLLYAKARTVGGAVLQHDKNYYASNGTVDGVYAECDTAGGAVVLTLDAAVDFTGRLVRINRVGGNTCTVGVTTGQSLDGVTNGTTTIPSAGWKTFIQTGDTSWVTQSAYPVTGISGLTATKLPVATSATAVGDSAITHVSATGVTTFGGSAPLLVLAPAGVGDVALKATSGSISVRNAADSASAILVASSIYADGGSGLGANIATVGDSVALVDDGYASPYGMTLKNGASISWPNSFTPTQAYTQTGVQVSNSKALVDATATAFSRVAVANNSYEGGVLHYTIFATDATDYQNRSGSVPFAIRNLGGTETCTFGTASDAYDGTGTLTVTWDCAAGTDTVDLRANANTSLASTTIFTIQARVDLTSGTATVTPQ